MSLPDTVDVIGIIIGIILVIYGIYSSDLGLFVVGTLYPKMNTPTSLGRGWKNSNTIPTINNNKSINTKKNIK